MYRYLEDEFTLTADYPDDARVCRNCAHWDTAHETIAYTRGGLHGIRQIKVCPCRVDAIEPDAGAGAVVLLGPDSHCRLHADAWEAAEEYATEFAAMQDMAMYNGVIPGVDFPASLGRRCWA